MEDKLQFLKYYLINLNRYTVLNIQQVNVIHNMKFKELIQSFLN